MNVVHSLKCWPIPFSDVKAGRKPFEYRLNDRNFKVGDCLVLQEWSKETGYTKDCFSVRVTYVLPGGTFGVPASYCVLGIEPWVVDSVCETANAVQCPASYEYGDPIVGNAKMQVCCQKHEGHDGPHEDHEGGWEDAAPQCVPPKCEPARIDTDGTAKPLTEIVGVFPTGEESFYHNAEGLIHRPTQQIPPQDHPEAFLPSVERHSSDPTSLRPQGSPDLGAPDQCPSESPRFGPYRVGRQLGRTLYLDDICIGMVDDPAIASVLVRAANEYVQRVAPLPTTVDDPEDIAKIAREAMTKLVELAREAPHAVGTDVSGYVDDVSVLFARFDELVKDAPCPSEAVTYEPGCWLGDPGHGRTCELGVKGCSRRHPRTNEALKGRCDNCGFDGHNGVCPDKARNTRHDDALHGLVKAAMDHLHEQAECPFHECELGKQGEDIACEEAKHSYGCPLAGYELTVDLEALLEYASTPLQRAETAKLTALDLSVGDEVIVTKRGVVERISTAYPEGSRPIKATDLVLVRDLENDLSAGVVKVAGDARWCKPGALSKAPPTESDGA